jgi:hypothetical protein
MFLLCWLGSIDLLGINAFFCCVTVGDSLPLGKSLRFAESRSSSLSNGWKCIKMGKQPSGEDLQTHGIILVDQIRSLDWRVGQIKFLETVSSEVIAEVQAKITPLIY